MGRCACGDESGVEQRQFAYFGSGDGDVVHGRSSGGGVCEVAAVARFIDIPEFDGGVAVERDVIEEQGGTFPHFNHGVSVNFQRVSSQYGIFRQNDACAIHFVVRQVFNSQLSSFHDHDVIHFGQVAHDQGAGSGLLDQCSAESVILRVPASVKQVAAACLNQRGGARASTDRRQGSNSLRRKCRC